MLSRKVLTTKSTSFFVPDDGFVPAQFKPEDVKSYEVGNIEGFWESERGGGYEGFSWAELDAFSEWTVRVGYESDNNWSLTGYVENVTDELNYAGSQVNSGLTPDWLVGPNRPRTAGVRFGYYFD